MFPGELSFRAFAAGLTYNFQEINGLWNVFTLRKSGKENNTENLPQLPYTTSADVNNRN